MRQREVESSFLLASLVAISLWIIGALFGYLLPDVVADSFAPRLLPGPIRLFCRILIRNTLVSIALVSGVITYGTTTLLSATINSFTFGRLVFPTVFILYRGQHLVLLAIFLELAAYVACSCVGIHPIAKKIGGLRRYNQRNPGQRELIRVASDDGARTSVLHRDEMIVFCGAILAALTVAAGSETAVLLKR